MDKTELVNNVATIFRLNGHKVETDVEINHRRIDVVAEEMQGIFRKTWLIECAEYKDNVGIGKAQDDLNKLNAAKEKLASACVCAHISYSGYSPQASGYLRDAGVSFSTYDNLISNMINFSPYVDGVESEKIRAVILKEYQETSIYFDGEARASAMPSISFVDQWIKSSNSKWLTILGDYGVGKSWTLKRVLYILIKRYKENPDQNSLPFFIPLQHFAKAFDYQNLIIRTLSRSGLTGVHFDAFQFLAAQGKIIFLLDSFDEMAQKLSRNIIRENLLAILDGMEGRSRVIMTSRPNYFENRAERIQMIDWVGGSQSSQLDIDVFEQQRRTAAIISEKMTRTDFARLTDLTPDQCMRLFEIALASNQSALVTLKGLFSRFQNLGSIAQRAVIARLLVTVAETLAGGAENEDALKLIPSDAKSINSGKIFEIVIYNLIRRDMGVGDIPPSVRLMFLRNLAVFLQSKATDQAAHPAELRAIVSASTSSIVVSVGGDDLQAEEYYRVCRRHAGLTTLGQFEDTTGQIDLPVDADDVDSPILFSHNSLREYLVADAIVDWLVSGTEYDFKQLAITDEICSFVWDVVEFTPGLGDILKGRFSSRGHGYKELLFRLTFFGISRRRASVEFLGRPANICDVDIGELSFAGMKLDGARISGCLSENTDFRGANLVEANFSGTDISGTMFDNAKLTKTDFRAAHIHSIYVLDRYGIGTSGILRNKEARQWLLTQGAFVHPDNDLNPLLGQPWYEAAREVIKTVLSKSKGTHQAASLAKGTDASLRSFASDFVEHLIRKGVLTKVVRSDQSSGWVVKLNSQYLSALNAFNEKGAIDSIFDEFFKKHHR